MLRGWLRYDAKRREGEEQLDVATRCAVSRLEELLD